MASCSVGTGEDCWTSDLLDCVSVEVADSPGLESTLAVG